MSFKSLPFSLSFAAAIVLLGAGCLNQVGTNSTQVQTPEPATQTTTIEVEAEETTELTPDSPCPEGMVRFWNVYDYDGYTFCYYENSLAGEKIQIKNFGNKIVLYAGDDPSFNHSVLMLRTHKNYNPFKEEIENEYIPATGQEFCEVLENRGDQWTNFSIVAGNLERQEFCGEFKDGSFRMLNNNTDYAFFVTIGQDTFMFNDAWLETLQPINNSKELNPTIPPANDFVNGQNTFSDTELGISFSYPADWGPITSETEMGRKDWNGNTLQANCLVQQSLKLNGVEDSALFLSGHNSEGCGPDGRGGWFGDQAQAFSSWDEVLGWCGDGCDIFTNSNGIRVAHRHLINKEIWGTNYDDLDLYGIFHEGSYLSGIILSNERLVYAGLGRSENELKGVVNSIKFLK